MKQNQYTCPYDEEKLAQTIRLSRIAFQRTESAAILSPWEFLWQQSRFIRKRWWLFQGLLLILVWWLICDSRSRLIASRLLGGAAPLFLLLALPELWKNRHWNAIEVEQTAFYSLRQIYAARMILFAGVDVALISLFFLGTCITSALTVWTLATGFLLPFTVTCCICFTCLYRPKGSSEPLAVLLCGLFTLLWEKFLLNEPLYLAVSRPMWASMLTVSLGYLLYCIHHGQRTLPRIQEVLPIWN